MKILTPTWRHLRYVRAVLRRPGRQRATDLRGDRVLVSGGSSGIGAAIASELVGAGATVVSIDVERPCQPTDGVETVLGDVRTFDFSTLSPFDVIVANAGVVDSSADGHLDDDSIRRLVDINLVGLVRTLDAPKTDTARAIVISSQSAVRAEPHGIVYGATKAAALNYGYTFGLRHPTTVAIVGITATRLFEAEARHKGTAIPTIEQGSMADPRSVAQQILRAYRAGHECVVTDRHALRDVAAFSNWLASAVVVPDGDDPPPASTMRRTIRTLATGR